MTTVLHQILDTASDLAPLTLKKYRSDLDAWELFAGADPSQWTPTRFQAFYEQLIHERNLKPQSANRMISSIRYASKWWARTNENFNLDFARFIRLAAPSQTKHSTPLNRDEIEALILGCRSGNVIHPIDYRDLALIIVSLETGMRRMSLAGMNLEAIGTRYGYPSVEVPIKGHGKDLYSVPLSDTALIALTTWNRWLASQKVRTGPVFRRLTKRIDLMQTKAIFHVEAEGISETMIQKIITHRAKDVEIHTTKRHVHPHLFRHTFVTMRREMQVPDDHIASVTGHSLAIKGALGGYIDMPTIGGKARNMTPTWLSDLVKKVYS